MASNGLGEIDAINKRIKSSKKNADNADANVELTKAAHDAAKANVELTKAAHDAAKAVCKATEAAYIAAMKQDKDAKEDVKDAEASLNAKVVDISSDEEGNDDEGKSGSAEAPVAASEEPEPVAQSNSANDGAENGSEKKRAAVPTEQSSSANKKARSDVDIFQVKSIEVSGCGTPEVNNTYVKVGMYHGAPQFTRRGKWKGKDATFSIWRGILGCKRCWFINVLGETILYKCRIEDDNDISPFNKVWELHYSGVAPPPKLEVKEFL